MRWLGLLALLCVGLTASAQAPAADLPETEPTGFQTRVLPERVLLGEPFTYEIIITHAPGERYELALPAELGDFELLSQSRQRQDGEGASTTTFGLRLSAFNLGLLTLPEVPFTVTTPEGLRRFVTPARTLEVGSTLPPEAQEKGAQLKDIQPPIEVAVRSWRLLWGLLGLVAVGLLAWALVRFLRRPRPERVVVAPVLPLDVRTRTALDALKAENLPAQGRVKDFYFRLSEVIRGYLGERYGFEALECTSSELLATVRRLPTPGLPEEALKRFVSESDMVKYAKAESSPQACGEALAFGYELLNKTWSPPAPPGAPAEPHASPGPRVS
jgi:hypothetical protein